MSDKKLNKNGLGSKGLKLLHQNFEVSETTEAAARGQNERIRGPTLVRIVFRARLFEYAYFIATARAKVKLVFAQVATVAARLCFLLVNIS